MATIRPLTVFAAADGFTVWGATGDWRGGRGAAEPERTLILAVARAYKTRLRHEAVLHERTVACSRLE